MEREKQPLKTLMCAADYDSAVLGKSSCIAGANVVSLPIGTTDEERAYVPTVGRWGCEWPIGGDTTTATVVDNNDSAAVFKVLKTTDGVGRGINKLTRTINSATATIDIGLLHLIGNTQVEGPWPIDHPLPLPRWDSQTKQPYLLNCLTSYENLVGFIEINVQQLLEEHNYNTVGNFLTLYHEYKRSNCSNFAQFFQSYSPPITPNHHTCVGLALELRNRLQYLDITYPNLSKHFYLVSCEENIEALSEYTALSERLDAAAYILEKEHVLLCMKFSINGRMGLLLCDPGYHVSRVVTVMLDKIYPHTGWFIQSDENNIRKEYNYQFSSFNENFIEWNETTTRNGNYQENFTGLIFIAKPYLTAVDVTERRNLVYNFRSLLARDQKGHLIAGIYFKVKENCDEFTIFYQDMGKQRMKINFSTLKHPLQIKEKILNIITICNEQLNLPEGSLLVMLKEIGELMNDKIYLRQLLDINQCINDMSANN